MVRTPSFLPVQAHSSVGAAPLVGPFESLRRVLPAMLPAIVKSRRGLRVWVPDCSSGEDVYSAAIVILELLGERWRETPVMVIGTDADAGALARARTGRFRRERARGLTAPILRRYFSEQGERVRPFVRDVCRFACQGAGQVPPFRGVDIIVSNGAGEQARAGTFRSYHAALTPRGLLITGVPPSLPGLFSKVAKVPGVYSAIVVAPELRAAVDGAANESYLGHVMHELRSPMAVIQCSAETLRKDWGIVEPGDYLRLIERQTEKMAHLVDRMLDLSATAARPRLPAPLPLSKALWKIVSLVLPQARRKRLSIRVEVPGNLSVLIDRADPDHLFGNLLDNAIKYTPRGGKIVIRALPVDRNVVVSIRDSGLGIPAEDLGRVFQRFYRSERTRHLKGTGLGLPLVRELAEANGGRISVESSRAGGTVFHVTLPSAS